MSWITITIDEMRIRPKSLIRMALWLSVLGLASVAAGSLPAESANTFTDLGLWMILFWFVMDYVIPGAWIAYQQFADRKGPSGI